MIISYGRNFPQTRYPLGIFIGHASLIVSARLTLFDASEASEKFSKIGLKFDQKLSKRAP